MNSWPGRSLVLIMGLRNAEWWYGQLPPCQNGFRFWCLTARAGHSDKPARGYSISPLFAKRYGPDLSLGHQPGVLTGVPCGRLHRLNWPSLNGQGLILGCCTGRRRQGGLMSGAAGPVTAVKGLTRSRSCIRIWIFIFEGFIRENPEDPGVR
jgi:hypothetical protein